MSGERTAMNDAVLRMIRTVEAGGGDDCVLVLGADQYADYVSARDAASAPYGFITLVDTWWARRVYFDKLAAPDAIYAMIPSQMYIDPAMPPELLPWNKGPRFGAEGGAA